MNEEALRGFALGGGERSEPHPLDMTPVDLDAPSTLRHRDDSGAQSSQSTHSEKTTPTPVFPTPVFRHDAWAMTGALKKVHEAALLASALAHVSCGLS